MAYPCNEAEKAASLTICAMRLPQWSQDRRKEGAPIPHGDPFPRGTFTGI